MGRLPQGDGPSTRIALRATSPEPPPALRATSPEPPPALRATSPNVASLLGEETVAPLLGEETVASLLGRKRDLCFSPSERSERWGKYRSCQQGVDPMVTGTAARLSLA